MYFLDILSPCPVSFFSSQGILHQWPSLVSYTIDNYTTHSGGSSYTAVFYLTCVYISSFQQNSIFLKDKNLHLFLISMQKKMSLKRKIICKKQI